MLSVTSQVADQVFAISASSEALLSDTNLGAGVSLMMGLLIIFVMISLVYMVLYRAAVKWVVKQDVEFWLSFQTVAACALIGYIIVFNLVPERGATFVNMGLFVLLSQLILLVPGSCIALSVSVKDAIIVSLVTFLVGFASYWVVVLLVKTIWAVQKDFA